MQKNNIFVAGGCMITQTGILPTKLFPQVLKKNVEQQTNSKISVKLELFNELLEINEKIITWAEKHPEDHIIIQYRPGILLRRLKLIIRENEQIAKYIWNPLIRTTNADNVFQQLLDKECATKKRYYFKQEKIEAINLNSDWH